MGSNCLEISLCKMTNNDATKTFHYRKEKGNKRRKLRDRKIAQKYAEEGESYILSASLLVATILVTTDKPRPIYTVEVKNPNGMTLFI